MRASARVGLGVAALAAVAATSVVLTLAVSRSDRPRTYTQEEVDRQLAAARAAEPTPSESATPSPSPGQGTGEIEGTSVSAEGTFVGRCVSGQALLSRWTLNAGYRVADLSTTDEVAVRWVPYPWLIKEFDARTKRSIWPSITASLVLEDDKNLLVWVGFSCADSKFTAVAPVRFGKAVPSPLKRR